MEKCDPQDYRHDTECLSCLIKKINVLDKFFHMDIIYFITRKIYLTDYFWTYDNHNFD